MNPNISDIRIIRNILPAMNKTPGSLLFMAGFIQSEPIARLQFPGF